MFRCIRKIPLIVLVLCFTGPGLAVAQTSLDESGSWDQFRGPLANGHAAATDLPVELESSENTVWQTELPGRGWSSPVIDGNEIWMTTAIEIEATGEERRKKMATAVSGGLSAYSRVELKAIQVNAQTGEVERTVDLFEINDPPLIHSQNSFASPTPVLDGQRVYCHFGTFGTAAVNRKTGNIEWKTQGYPLDHETGPGSSPILYEGLMIVHCDGRDLQYVLALDADTGKQVWRTERSGKMHKSPMMKKAFCTPIVIERHGRDELISPAANWVYSYDPKTGEELWKLNYGQLGFSNVARPVVNGETLFICTCFTQSRLLAVDLDGPESISESDVKWSWRKQVPNKSSPIVVENALYMINDRGIASCLDAEEGMLHWVDRLGGSFSSSPIYADGKLFVGNHDGGLFVIHPTTEKLDILATHYLDSPIMASPAAIGNSLYVRTAKSLYRFQKPGASSR